MSTVPIEIRPVDRRFYEERLRGFLPPAIIDVHTHVWLERFRAAAPGGPARTVTWPARVARDQPIEALIETYRLMLPGQSVTPVLFANALDPADDLDGGNAYVADAAARHGCPALLFARPQWPAEALEARLAAGKFAGVKVYLSLADAVLPADEIRIFDFLPPHQLDVLQKRGGVVMLHIPRRDRLRDPVNLAQLLELEQRWPAVKLIVAHVGRAYCAEDIGPAFEVLKPAARMTFDLAANTNAEVFRRLLDAVGPQRVVFGSDLPITRMRMRRICERGRYVNLVPRGLYGDVAGDPHMREVNGAEAEALTLFLYEELDAFRRAAEAAGLGRPDIEAVFHANAAQLLAPAAPPAQLQMIWPRPRLAAPPAVTIAPGYALRTYRPGDDDAYIALMRSAGFTTWGAGDLAHTLRTALPDGLFFAVHQATGALAATAAAQHAADPQHPFGSALGWVAAAPGHQGHGLGCTVCAAVVGRLLKAGYTDIHLKTDDFRLPALRTYLKMGWVPWLFAPDMAARWAKVAEALHLDMAKLGCES
jgi:uncharacterized protein